jgi:hypothetical protein
MPSLHTATGQRKYLTGDERARFPPPSAGSTPLAPDGTAAGLQAGPCDPS